MARSILAAVERIKSEVGQVLTPGLINSVCVAIGHVWRERLLDPVTTVHLFVLQVLHGNTACAHVPRLGGVACSGEAYGQARQRLPLALLQFLLRLLSQRLRSGALLDDGVDAEDAGEREQHGLGNEGADEGEERGAEDGDDRLVGHLPASR